MIPFKWKIVAGVVALVILLGVGFYLWSDMKNKEFEKKLKEAKERVEQLIREKEKFEQEIKIREKNYQVMIKSINENLKKKQMEVERLENKITELQRERENIVVPDSPDDIVDGFRKAGFRSCTRIRKPK